MGCLDQRHATFRTDFTRADRLSEGKQTFGGTVVLVIFEKQGEVSQLVLCVCVSHNRPFSLGLPHYSFRLFTLLLQRSLKPL